MPRKTTNYKIDGVPPKRTRVLVYVWAAFTFRPTRTALIAEKIGVSQWAVNRSIQTLERLGIIRFTGTTNVGPRKSIAPMYALSDESREITSNSKCKLKTKGEEKFERLYEILQEGCSAHDIVDELETTYELAVHYLRHLNKAKKIYVCRWGTRRGAIKHQRIPIYKIGAFENVPRPTSDELEKERIARRNIVQNGGFSVFSHHLFASNSEIKEAA